MLGQQRRRAARLSGPPFFHLFSFVLHLSSSLFLLFQVGDIIEVASIADIGWWKGTVLRTHQVGYFDQTNVEIVEEKEVAALLAQLLASAPAAATAHDKRKSLRSILVAIDLELNLLRDACDMQIPRPRSLPDRLDHLAAIPNKPSEPLPPLPPQALLLQQQRQEQQQQQQQQQQPQVPTTITTTLSPIPPAVPSKALKPSLSLPAPSSASPEPQEVQTRPKRSVTFSEDLVTVIEEERIQERTVYLAERKKVLTETLKSLESDIGAEKLAKHEERLRKTASFLCEERILPELGDEESSPVEKSSSSINSSKGSERKKRNVWGWIARRKAMENKPQKA